MKTVAVIDDDVYIGDMLETLLTEPCARLNKKISVAKEQRIFLLCLVLNYSTS